MAGQKATRLYSYFALSGDELKIFTSPSRMFPGARGKSLANSVINK